MVAILCVEVLIGLKFLRSVDQVQRSNVSREYENGKGNNVIDEGEGTKLFPPSTSRP